MKHAKCKAGQHDWRMITLSDREFQCKRCGRGGKNRRMWSRKLRDYVWRVVANMPR